MKSKISALILCIFALVLFLGCSIANTHAQSDISADIASSFYQYTKNADGTYTAENGITYQELKHLEGRDSGAACDSYFDVLTNNPNVTFHEVSWSLVSSQSTDALDENETIILRLGTVEQ